MQSPLVNLTGEWRGAWEGGIHSNPTGQSPTLTKWQHSSLGEKGRERRTERRGERGTERESITILALPLYVCSLCPLEYHTWSDFQNLPIRWKDERKAKLRVRGGKSFGCIAHSNDRPSLKTQPPHYYLCALGKGAHICYHLRAFGKAIGLSDLTILWLTWAITGTNYIKVLERCLDATEVVPFLAQMKIGPRDLGQVWAEDGGQMAPEGERRRAEWGGCWSERDSGVGWQGKKWNKNWNSWIRRNKSQAHSRAGIEVTMKSSARQGIQGWFSPVMKLRQARPALGIQLPVL